MTTYRKSIANIGLAIGGVLISEGGGESDFLTITSEARGGSKAGVHGDVVFYDLPAGSRYTATLSLLETSTSNKLVQELFNAQYDGTTSGTYTFSFEDVGTTEEFSGQCLIVKEPDRKKTAEAGSYEWEIHISSPTPFRYRARSVTV